MKEFLNFDKNYNRHIRIFYFVFSLLGIFGNATDIVTNFHSWYYLLNWFNLFVILIILLGIITYLRNIISIKTGYIITLYSVLGNIILSNLTTIFTDTESNVFLLREALFACFLITAAYLFLNEIHGLITGLVFLVYFITASFLSRNQFLISNLPQIVVLYSSYIIILNYFRRFLKHSIQKISDDSKIIKNQNEELTNINNELNDSQLHITAQNEEVLTLSESVSNQNRVLEEQNAKLEEAMQQKSKLFSIIAHDIKSPLYSMASLMELMLEKYDELSEDRKKNYLTKMLSSNKLLQSLIENLLTWSRSQTGMIEMKPEKIELESTIDKIIDIYKNFASNKSLQLTREVEEDLFVVADRMMIETILRNLISNAIKYSFEHGIVCIHAEKQGMYIKIAIQDYGIGIEQERMNTLFSYSNGIITLGTKGEKGTGLGLRICKEFIEKLNGKIWIESEAKRGTTIYFILPYTSI